MRKQPERAIRKRGTRCKVCQRPVSKKHLSTCPNAAHYGVKKGDRW